MSQDNYDDSFERAYEEYEDAILEGCTEYATIQLPDGRLVDAKCQTSREGNHYYFLPETLELEWHDPLNVINDPVLTDKETHEIIDDMYLHEWVIKNWNTRMVR